MKTADIIFGIITWILIMAAGVTGVMWAGEIDTAVSNRILVASITGLIALAIIFNTRRER